MNNASSDPVTYWLNPSACPECNRKATPQVFVFKRRGQKINSRKYRYLQCDACKIEWTEEKESK